jgi:hypothetical protein
MAAQALGSRLLALLLALTLAGPATAQAPEARARATPQLGVNLAPVSDYSQTPVFVDLMEQARRFGSPQAPWDEKAALGADGWPLGDFGVVLLVGQARVPETAGVYTLSFTGQARVDVVASPAQLRRARYDAQKNRSTLELVMPPGADQLMLRFDGTGSGIKDLRVIRPGYNALQPPRFTRLFLQHIAPFQTLRFMDWLRTNGSSVRSWAQRADPRSTHHLSAAGVPWERVLELANTNHSDLWINLPVQADDDYIRQLALLCRSMLRPELHVYLEYSNEVWNPGFGQFHSNLQLARDETAADAHSTLRAGGETDINTLAFRRTAKRLLDMAAIFRSVYGPQAYAQRIRPVLAAQVVQPYILELQLRFIALAYGPPADHLYGVAVAPYFNLGPRQTEEQLSADQVLAAMDASVNRLPRQNALESNVALARWYGLPLLAYEGGSDTFGAGSLQAKRQASHDPRMRALCQRYLGSWFDAGGDLFMWFQAGAGDWSHRFGSWELSESLLDSSAPKLRCLQEFAAQYQPQAAQRNALPGSVQAMDFVGSFAPYTRDAQLKLRYLHPGQSLDYLLWSPVARDYQLGLRAEAGLPGNTLQLAIDGRSMAPALELRSAGWGTLQETGPLTVHLGAGFHTLRLRTLSETSGFRLDALLLR